MEESRDGEYNVIGDTLVIEIPAPHAQVLPFYPQYRTDEPSPLAIEDYRDPANCCGHTQRAYLNYWAIRSFIESAGGIGLDLGSAGVRHIACLALDLYGNGEVPVYGGIMSGVQVKANAADLSIFQNDSFSCVLNSHLVEHLPCEYLYGTETVAEKIAVHCPGTEILPVLREWVRVLRPGGYLVMILPDNEPAQAARSHVFAQDVSHQHAFSANNFYLDIIKPLKNEELVDMIEHNTFSNNFSFNTVLKKR